MLLHMQRVQRCIESSNKAGADALAACVREQHSMHNIFLVALLHGPTHACQLLCTQQQYSQLKRPIGV